MDCVTIDRIEMTSHRDIEVNGFFVYCADGQDIYGYFFSPSGRPGPSTAGTQRRRPADTPAGEVSARRPRLDDTARR
jgi:hypothetical protein